MFNGHDLLDQPEHASGCPAGLIMGGWAGEAGGPINNGGVMCVECAKWVEPRHLSQFVERNQIHRQPSLKWVFFNGDGYNTWESIWGGWNGISDRDAETIRRIFAIFRVFQVRFCSFFAHCSLTVPSRFLAFELTCR